MAFLFGFQAADLGPTSPGSIVGADSVKFYDEAGGFIVPQDCTIENIYVDITSDNPAVSFKVALYDRATGALITASDIQPTNGVGVLVPVAPAALTQNQAVAIALTSNNYLSANREDTNYRFFDNMDAIFAEPFPPLYVKKNSSNSGRIEIWADGYLGFTTEPTIVITGNLQPGATVTCQLQNFTNYPAEIQLTQGSIVRTLPLVQVAGNEHTFQMPALPAVGATAQLFKVGQITARVEGVA